MMRARRKKVRYILVDRFGGFYDRQLRLLSGVFRRFDASFLGGLYCVLCQVFPCEKISLGFSSCPGGFESEWERTEIGISFFWFVFVCSLFALDPVRILVCVNTIVCAMENALSRFELNWRWSWFHSVFRSSYFGEWPCVISSHIHSCRLWLTISVLLSALVAILSVFLLSSHPGYGTRMCLSG